MVQGDMRNFEVRYLLEGERRGEFTWERPSLETCASAPVGHERLLTELHRSGSIRRHDPASEVPNLHCC